MSYLKKYFLIKDTNIGAKQYLGTCQNQKRNLFFGSPFKIDLRLREITQKNVRFGNIAIIALGDLMQMSPISGRFIFKEPRDSQFTLSHEVDPLWQNFQCINRQNFLVPEVSMSLI